jgi:hypothetical protein
VKAPSSNPWATCSMVIFNSDGSMFLPLDFCVASHYEIYVQNKTPPPWLSLCHFVAIRLETRNFSNLLTHCTVCRAVICPISILKSLQKNSVAETHARTGQGSPRESANSSRLDSRQYFAAICYFTDELTLKTASVHLLHLKVDSKFV